jgi:hypothetical protein
MLSPYLEHDYSASHSGGFLRERLGKLEARRNSTDTGAGRTEGSFFNRIFTAERHSSEKSDDQENPAQKENGTRMRQLFGSYSEHGSVRFCKSDFQRDD